MDLKAITDQLQWRFARAELNTARRDHWQTLPQAHRMQLRWLSGQAGLAARAGEQRLCVGSALAATQNQVDAAICAAAFDRAVECDQRGFGRSAQGAASRFHNVSLSSRLSQMPQPIGLKVRASSRRYQAPGRRPAMRSVRV